MKLCGKDDCLLSYQFSLIPTNTRQGKHTRSERRKAVGKNKFISRTFYPLSICRWSSQGRSVSLSLSRFMLLGARKALRLKTSVFATGITVSCLSLEETKYHTEWKITLLPLNFCFRHHFHQWAFTYITYHCLCFWRITSDFSKGWLG